ncbi:winged helix-turn-helix domain-containing protein [Variovorax sp. J22P168]|uniref:ATP-binding protein n=1 Tax=Variovorax jilinensis TaxID=3053513 RepID=UPI0025762945|nr:winged helix-turn-helix domain-containing protein [Variovorax sp. J22P168]MDM0015252.1 winged helix-turn-helix domain-containing protein [Variovorax sp. J22P168]
MDDDHEIAVFGPYRLSASTRHLQRGEESVALGGRAMDLLIALVERVGEVVSRRDLMRRAWPDLVVEEANLRVHIGSLRKTLGEGRSGDRYITNVAGRGYCFVVPVSRLSSKVDSFTSAPVVSPRTPNGLPKRLSRMVGRDEVVEVLSSLLRSRRFVSLVGVGGVGKTTVAVSVTYEVLNRFDGGVHFVDLSVIEDPSLVVDAVCSATGMTAGLQDPILSLRARLEGNRALLVLDNCERQIDSVALLVEQLHAALPGLHILATSREPLRVEGEHVYLLPPLETPTLDRELTASLVLESPAAQLFMDRAEAGGFHSGLLDQDALVVALLCERLDGIPLALELAGGCVGTYGVHGAAKLLDDRFKLLLRGRRSAPPRHQTLHAMVDWSYNLMSAMERRIFARLSVFVGHFTLEDAQSVVCDDATSPSTVASTLASLVDKSLVSTMVSTNIFVFRLLETTRVHAAGKLVDSGELSLVARRYDILSSQVGLSRATAAAKRRFRIGAESATSMHKLDTRASARGIELISVNAVDGGDRDNPHGVELHRAHDAQIACVVV